jgi:TolA-binding protein
MDRSPTVLRRGARRRSLDLIRRRSVLSTFLLAAWFAAAPASPAAPVQDGQRPDQVHVHDKERDRRTVVTGVVVENTLTSVRVEREGKETRVDPVEVERITWGTVSPAFREAQVFYDRGDYENAAARFRQATDTEERDVTKAVARWRAGEALLELGASDPSRYAEALEEFQRFLADHPQNRHVPQVRMMQARATRLSGDAKAAGALYKSLYEEGASATPTPGYDRLLCMRAGLEAAESLIEAGETLGAREILGVLKSSISSMQPQVAADSAESEELARLAAEADLGEGYVLIANEQASQAESFFQSRLQNADSAGATMRYGAMMGLGEAYRAENKYNEARVLFARVSAIDFTNRDRSARALLRLAQTTLDLKEPDATARARKWLTELVESFGDTPSAGPARELLTTL